jgi:hypothetical protein
MISGLTNSTIDATTVGSGKAHGAHKRPDPEDLFKKMDSNGDGSVSEQEFESTVVNISPQGTNAANSADAQSRAEAEFKKTDTDGDGKVSESELAAAMKSHEAEHQGGAEAEAAAGGAQGARPAGGGGGGSVENTSASSSASKTYDPADTNEDGVVSEQEAIAYAAKQATQTSQNATAAVKSYDEISSLSGGPQASQAAE